MTELLKSKIIISAACLFTLIAYNTEVSGSIYEKTATLDIGLKLRSYCGSLAKSIYMTRTTDETVGETLRESRNK